MIKNHDQKVQSVVRALHLLEIISQERKIGVSELARKSNLKKTTVVRLADTLAHAGFIDQNTMDKSYSLTVKLFEIGSRAPGSLDIRRHSRPIIERFVNKHGVSVLLSMLDGNEVLYIDKVEAKELFRTMFSAGSRGPVHCTASGKAMLAFLKPQMVKEILKGPLLSFTPNTLTDYDSLEKDFAEVRARGYSLDKRERHPDLCSVAAAIFNSSGEVSGAVSVPRMATMSDLQLVALGEQVALLAREISERQGWPGNFSA